jgi:acetylornithine deacetylase/succinyl-diaminopimelate desuccinylase-like protein
VLLVAALAAAARVDGGTALSPAATRLAAYLAVDNTNPPGNERAGAELLAGMVREAGIEPQLFVSPQGRVSLYASLPATVGTGTGASEGAIVLLHHIDTVPAGEGWRYPPHAGELHDGALWGRGAIDTKGLGIAHLEAFLDLARSPLPRRRAVVFLAVADEEAGGGEGTGWLLGAHPELFANVAAVLNEGGVNKAVAGRPLFWGIEIDQKRPLWLEVVAAGRPGHASAANPESATHRLVTGLARLVAAPRPRRVTPAASDFLTALARFDPQARAALGELRALPSAPEPSRSGAAPALSLPGFESLVSDTLQITTLAGSDRINVVAGEARAGIDIRLLPDTDEKAFLAEVERLLGPGLTVAVRLTSPAAPPSPASGPVYRALAATLATPAPTPSPGATAAAVPVVPAFIPAFTDSRYFRARGIAAYGFSPFALDGLELRTVHAPDERMPLATLDRGVATMVRVLRALALAESAAP